MDNLILSKISSGNPGVGDLPGFRNLVGLEHTFNSETFLESLIHKNI